MTIDPELERLADILADWSRPAGTINVFLFGSRVRGDHRPDSDVDVIVDVPWFISEVVAWWLKEKDTGFRVLQPRLPGPLKILESDDHEELYELVVAGTVVHERENVSCVWLPPRPNDTPSLD